VAVVAARPRWTRRPRRLPPAGRKYSAIAISEITVDEPPNETSGNVTPVYGSEFVTTATLTSVWTVNMQVRPVASSRENASGARQAIMNPRQDSTPNRARTPKHPRKPSSSPMMAKMASVCAFGTQ